MNVHFISIGGSVMHQLAIALKQKGYYITGSDDDIFEPSYTNLQLAGLLPPTMGWDVLNINSKLDAVIVGMHAKADNPELLQAQALGLKIYSFPAYIYSESVNKKRVVIGGSHGKTTTTAMVMHVLKKVQLHFDYLVGARLDGFEQSVKITNAPIIVCEGDEYPASALEKQPKFHFLFPHIAIITGIAWDHINVFPTFEVYLEQFTIFINKIEPNGLLIYNQTDEVLTHLIEKINRKDLQLQPYAMPKHQIQNGITTIEMANLTTSLSIFGNHNLLNLHAAYYTCKALGISTPNFMQAISSFSGAAKRLEVVASNHQTTIFRDFAHAPSKVKATMDAVKMQYPDRKLIAVFELHTYSSFSPAFMPEYNGTLEEANEACVFYSSHALEIKGMAALQKEVVLNGFCKQGLSVITNKEALEKWLQEKEYANTSLLLMSSGNYEGMDIKMLAKMIM